MTIAAVDWSEVAAVATAILDLGAQGGLRGRGLRAPRRK